MYHYCNLSEFFWLRLYLALSSDAASGWAGCALVANPEFGSSVNPIPTKRDRLCPPHYWLTTRLQNITASLPSLCNSDLRILSYLFFCRNLPYYPIVYTIQDKNWQQKFPRRLVQFGYKKNGISGPPRPIFGRQGRQSGGHISGVPPLFILQNPDKA